MLAYAGSIRGHETIDEAIADPACRAWVELFWDEASRHSPFPPTTSPTIEQRCSTGSPTRGCATSSPGSRPTARPSSSVRTVPTVRAERAAGRVPVGCATTLAAWVLHLRGAGAPVKDPGAASAQQAANSGELPAAVPAVLDTLEPGLGGDSDFVDAVVTQAELIQR